MKKQTETPVKARKRSSASSMRLSLESRLLFDGAVVATMNDAVDDKATASSTALDAGQDDNTADNAGFTFDFSKLAAVNQATDVNADVPLRADLSSFSAGHSDAKTLFIVDSKADAAADLLKNPPANSRVEVIDDSQDAYQQIAGILQNRTATHAMYLIPRTETGNLMLGHTSIDRSITVENRSAVSDWANDLSDDAKIVLVGDDRGENGLWTKQVQALTGSQVSRSNEIPAADSEKAGTFDKAASVIRDSSTKEVVFIDRSVANPQEIIAAIDSGSEVVYLDSDKSGLTQIADYLSLHKGTQTVHVVSHGSVGKLFLGNSEITLDTIKGEDAQAFATIKASLADNADILIYGCDVAGNGDGEAFVNALASATGADIAASTNDTGNASLGADWVLEDVVGSVESTAIHADNYTGLLTPPPVIVAPNTIVGIEDVSLVIKDLTITDPDNSQQTVTLTSPQGKINLSTINGLLTVTGNGTGLVTFKGSLADVDAALKNMTLTAPPDFNGPTTLDIKTFDGKSTRTKTIDVQFTPTNDAPKVTALGTGITISTPGVAVPVTGMSISDVDYNDNGGINTAIGEKDFIQATVRVLNKDGNPLPLSAYAGQITLGSNSAPVEGSTFEIDNTENGIGRALVIRGNLSDVNAYLAGLNITLNGAIAKSGQTYRLQVIADDRCRDLPTGTLIAANTANGGLNPDGPDAGTEPDPVPTKFNIANTYSTIPSGLSFNVSTASRPFTVPAKENTPPVANDDGPIQTKVNEPIKGNVITGAGGGTQDTDADNDPLTVTQFTIDTNGDGIQETVLVPAGGKGERALTDTNGKAIGSLTIESDGTFSFNPAPDYKGPVPSATYTITDGKATDTAVLSFSPVPNAAPVANPDINRTPENTTLNVTAANGVLGNDSDANGDGLTVTTFTVVGDPKVYNAGETATIPGKGTLVLNPDGSYTFTPATGFNGQVPTVNYTVTDQGGVPNQASSTLDITVDPKVDPANIPPVANDDGPIQTKANEPIKGNVITGAGGGTQDTDADNDPLTVTQFTIDTNGDGIQETVLVPAGGKGERALTDTNGKAIGSLTIESDGTFSFNPAPDYKGPVPSATYTITDGKATDTAVLSFSPVPNAAPVANPDINRTPENTTLNVTAANGVLGNDSDANGDGLTVTTFTVVGDPKVYNAGETATIPGKGTLVLNPDGSYTFTPATGFNGQVPTVNYTVTDQGGVPNQASSTLDITVDPKVDPANIPPVANDDGPIQTKANEPIKGNVITGAGGGTQDTDADNDPLTVTQFTIDTNGDGIQETVLVPAGGKGERALTDTNGKAIGSLTIESDGTFSFNPAPDYKGPVPSATYTITDGKATDTAVLSFSPVPNAAPVANPDINRTPENTTLNVTAANGVLGNDSDANGDGLTVTTFTVVGDPKVYNAGETATIPGKGTLVLNPDGSYTFTPATGFNGQVPTVNYTVTDQGGVPNQASSTLDITVDPKVDPANIPPVANDDGPIQTKVNEPIKGNVITGAGGGTQDTDADNDPLTVTQFTIDTNGDGIQETVLVPAGGKGERALTDTNGKAIGSLTIESDGTFSFNPAPDYKGSVPSATYTITDGKATDTAVLSFSPVPNAAPVANPDINRTPENTTLNVTAANGVLGNDSDANGDGLTVTTFTVVGDPKVYNAGETATIPGKGTLVLNPEGSYTFTPATGFNGQVPTVNYTVTDQGGVPNQASSTLDITVDPKVDPANIPPVANDDGPIQTKANEPIKGNVITGAGGGTQDTDADNDLLTVTQFKVDTNGDGNEETFTVPPGGKAETALTDNGGKVIGTLIIESDGTFSFNPAPGYAGSVPSATYTITDGKATDTAVLSFRDVPSQGSPLNPPPVANDDGPIPTFANITVTGNVITGAGGGTADTDPNNDPLSVTQYLIDTDGNGTFETIIVKPGGNGSTKLTDTLGRPIGNLTVASDGTFTFVPAAGYDGPVPSATYTITDGTSTASAVLSFVPIPPNAPGVNKPPIANNDGPIPFNPYGPTEGNVITGKGGGTADSDPDGDPLTVTQFTIPNVGTFPAGTKAIIPGKGSLVINPDGSFVFTPNKGFIGPVPTATYTITDGLDTDTAELSFSPDVNIGPIILLSNPPRTPTPPEPGFGFVPLPILKPTLVDDKITRPTLGEYCDLYLTIAMRDHVVLEKQYYSFSVPTNAFSHCNEYLEYTATRRNGLPLPKWIRFDPQKLLFSGIPPKGALITEVMLSVTDRFGNKAHTLFNVIVNKLNDHGTCSTPLAAHSNDTSMHKGHSKYSSSAHKTHHRHSVMHKLLGHKGLLSHKTPIKDLIKHKHKINYTPSDCVQADSPEKGVATIGKPGFSEQLWETGKLSRLAESRALLDSLANM